MSITHKCSSCGAPAAETDKFCAVCGAPVVAVEDNDAPSSPYKCSVCGAPAAETDKFCAVCGGAVVNSNDANTANTAANGDKPAKEKKAFPKKAIALLAAAVVVVILVIALANLVFSSKYNYVAPENDISCIYLSEDEKSVILYNGERYETAIDGNVTSSATSLDGETFAALSSDGTLYVFTDKKGLVKVKSDVSSFKLAVDGEYLAYINEDDELIHYSIKNGKSSKVTDELLSTSAYVLSPDGKTLAYSEGTYGDYDLYIYKNEKKEKIDEGLTPLGITDGAKLVYYYNSDKDAVYVVKGDKDAVKLMSDVYGDGSLSVKFRFNCDNTQMLFSNGSSVYVTIDGGEKQKVLSKNLAQNGSINAFYNTVSQGSGASTTAMISFAEQYYLDAKGDLYYVNKKLEAEEIAEDVVSFKTDSKGKVIYYLDDDEELFRSNGPKSKFKSVAKDVYGFDITSDGEKCYFVDEDDTLHYVKKTGKAKKVADDVYNNISITHDGYALFIVDYSTNNGGTLYSSVNGKKGKKIADDVYGVSATDIAAAYKCESDDDTYDFYYATKKDKFELAVKEIG